MKLASLLLAVLCVADLALIYGTGLTFWIVFTPIALSIPFFLKAAKND